MNKSGNENRSVRNTKKRLREGLLALLQQKPIKEITVRELTELVDVNRGTFYFHYSDVYDMLYKMEDEFFIQFETMLSADSPKDREDAYPYLLKIFTFLAENKDMCRIFFSQNCDMQFFLRIKRLVEERCSHLWKNSGLADSEEHCELYSTFIVNGCAGLMQKWLDDDLKETPAEITTLVLKIIFS